MGPVALDLGTIVRHPKRPEWGPGKVLGILGGGKVVVYFRDLPEGASGDAVKTISTAHVSLELAEQQSDPMLDHLPPFEKGRFVGQKRPRLSIQQAIDGFLQQYPHGFSEPRYLDDERTYKLRAHEQWQTTLGGGQLRALLDAGEIDEARRRVSAVEGKLNLLAVFEKAGLSDALKDENAAAYYFNALVNVLDADTPSEPAFNQLAKAVEQLPVREGGSRVATWPILTEFPFIARPDAHMLLKPESTKRCAERLNFDLRYGSELLWSTYSRLLEMTRILLGRLSPLGARDHIDVQTFMFLIAEM